MRRLKIMSARLDDVIDTFQRVPLNFHSTELRAWLSSQDRRQLPEFLGLSGFTLPTIDHARIRRYRQANDVIHCFENGRFDPKPIVKFIGTAAGNVIVIGPRATIPKSIVVYGRNNVCIIAGDNRWGLELEIRFSSDEGLVFVGLGTTSNGTSIILEGNRRSVVIGDDCMFAAETAILTSDLHCIRDRETGAPLNASKDVLIHPHVWVGQGSMIVKNAVVGAGAIIGAKSLVTGSIASSTVVGGLPARLLRENVEWSRERPVSD